MVDQHGDDYATNVETLVASGPFMVESWEKSNNSMVLVRNPTYTGPWPSQVDRVEIDPSLGAPEVGLPAFMAGEVDFTPLNAGQIPFVEQRMADALRQNAIFATSYIAFDMTSPPFDNPDVRKALYFAVDRQELTETVLRNLAIPAGSILPPSYPGYSEEIAAQAVFDPERAREHLAAAGYPGGRASRRSRSGTATRAATTARSRADAPVPPAEFQEHLGITMNIRVMPMQDWMNALMNKENNLFLAPYEYDYIDPSNFYGHLLQRRAATTTASRSTTRWSRRPTPTPSGRSAWRSTGRPSRS
jgi:ABC-type oligopeptide transport system substrate-binding subunit